MKIAGAAFLLLIAWQPMTARSDVGPSVLTSCEKSMASSSWESLLEALLTEGILVSEDLAQIAEAVNTRRRIVEVLGAGDVQRLVALRVLGREVGREEDPQKITQWIEQYIQRHYPLTNMTIYSAAEFANFLSQEEGLSQAYLVEGEWGDVGDGSLVARRAEFFEHQFSQIEGYRLPNEVEWVVMVLAAYREWTMTPKKDRSAVLEKWGWFNGRSSKQLRPVGQLPSLPVGEGQVFDPLGLVCELVHPVELVGKRRITMDALPQNEFCEKKEAVLLRGLCYRDSSNAMENPSESFEQCLALFGRVYMAPDGGGRHDVGFRLVRTILKEN